MSGGWIKSPGRMNAEGGGGGGKEGGASWRVG